MSNPPPPPLQSYPKLGGGSSTIRTPKRTSQTLLPSKTLYNVGGEKVNAFEFDAPQYEDFSKPQYWSLRRLLEEIVLPPEQRSVWAIENIPVELLPFPHSVVDESSGENNSEGDDNEWFQRAHTEHEPTSPSTPVGPLITPERKSSISLGKATCRPHSTINSGTKSPQSNHDGPLNSDLQQTPTPVRNFGLCSKPMRVLHAIGGDSPFLQSSVGGGSSPTNFYYSQVNEIKSPTTGRWNVAVMSLEARNSSSIEEDGHSSDIAASNNTTSIPSIGGWSSIPETPPILASGILLDGDPNLTVTLRKRSLPKDSPLSIMYNPSESSNPPARRIGLASRVLRTQQQLIVESSKDSPRMQENSCPLVEPEPDEPKSKPRLEPPQPPHSPILFRRKNRPKPPPPTAIKRVRVDGRFCPVPESSTIVKVFIIIMLLPLLIRMVVVKG